MKKHLHLRNRTMLFCIMATLVGTLFLGYAKYQSSQKLIVNIGSYESQQAEEKAAVQRLSLELAKHPKVNSIRILVGTAPGSRGVIGFVRKGPGGQKNIFWIDNRSSSAAFNINSGIGIRAEVLVSEEPIHEAAHHLSTFDDVNNYNDQLRLKPLLNAPAE